DKGTYDNKLVYFPNWAEDIFAQQVSANIPTLPTGFKVMFAGNIGEAQDFEHVMQAAVNLKNDKEIKFILVGDGRKKAWVDDFIHKKQLQDTVFTLGRFPIETMPAFLRKADVMLLSLKDNDIFSLTVPAKLQTYMAASKPVVAMINGEARNLIAESDCGLSCPAGDSDGLATNIRLLKIKTLTELDLLGKNGYAYYQKHFTKDTCITHLCEIIENKA
ncbi:MAG: glycosyltransferase family 4 protein, partial [Candidatus Phocaeicola faecipullorum]|nr:glycosyltransferase family 4 protein [Candidatus Phocaeicola faecipullorum]